MVFGGIGAGAAPVAREDLSACELPHGSLELAEQGSAGALQAGGYIFEFGEEKLLESPWDKANERARSMEEYVRRIRAEKAGDVMYSSLNGGTLMAVSGRIRDLGEHFLYELSGKKLKRPAKVWGTEERDSTGKGMPGAIEGVEEGRCYLVETLEGKFALVRLIEEKGRSAVVDWVYQPSGKRVFSIPKGKLIEPAPAAGSALDDKITPVEAQEFLRIAAIKEAQVEAAVGVHLSNRKTLIEALVNVIKAPEESVWAKAVAVRTLGEIRASDAAGLMADVIDVAYPASQVMTDAGASHAFVAESTIFNTFGCVPALVRIGKPGSAACLEAITKLTDEEKKRPRREKLLVLVIVRVEGEKFARLLLEDKKASVAKNREQVENLERAIALIDEVKSWR
jgi:hypothetical protein